MQQYNAINNFHTICRLCGEASSELIKLHHRKDKQRITSIHKYLGIKIVPSDCLPDHICGPCVAKLEEMIEFIEKAKRIQEDLQNFLQSSSEAAESLEVAIKDEPMEESSSALKTAASDLNLESNHGKETCSSSEMQPSEMQPISTAPDYVKGNPLDDFLNKAEKRPRKRLKASAYVCPVCNKGFPVRKALKLHIDKVHVDSMEKCPKCPKVYRSKYLWRSHILIHSQDKSFHCDQCDKSYTNSMKLLKHKETHTPIEQRYKFSCEICGKRFTSKNNIKLHMKRHEGVTPFICDRCGKSYQTKGNLEVHYRTHTGEMPFECEICGKRYMNEQPFKVHKLRHAGEKPHVCPHCSKTFLYHYVLKRHILTHTGLRPYPCSYCGKSFRDQWKRKVHERIHTGDRPYKCSLCPSAFYESGNLQKHCRNVHNQDYRDLFLSSKPNNEGTLPELLEFKETGERSFPELSVEEKEPEEHTHAAPETNPLLGHSIFSSAACELLRPM